MSTPQKIRHYVFGRRQADGFILAQESLYTADDFLQLDLGFLFGKCNNAFADIHSSIFKINIFPLRIGNLYASCTRVNSGYNDGMNGDGLRRSGWGISAIFSLSEASTSGITISVISKR